MWDIKLNLTDTDSSVVVARGKEVGRWEVEGDIIYGGRKWVDFRWRAHSTIYRSST